MYMQTENAFYTTPKYQYWFIVILGWFSENKNSEWDLDPPTHFHSKLEFLEFFSLPNP